MKFNLGHLRPPVWGHEWNAKTSNASSSLTRDNRPPPQSKPGKKGGGREIFFFLLNRTFQRRSIGIFKLRKRINGQGGIMIFIIGETDRLKYRKDSNGYICDFWWTKKCLEDNKECILEGKYWTRLENDSPIYEVII